MNKWFDQAAGKLIVFWRQYLFIKQLELAWNIINPEKFLLQHFTGSAVWVRRNRLDPQRSHEFGASLNFSAASDRSKARDHQVGLIRIWTFKLF